MDKKKLNEILQVAVKDGITDIIFAVGEPVLFRFSDTLMEVYRRHPLKAEDVELLARILLEGKVEELNINSFQSAEVSYELENVARFRASVFKQRYLFRIVMRLIPLELRMFADLNLPEEFGQIAELKRGLVLVSGATGQGKSTTISAMVQHINRTRRAHIVTIEDPIEFVYPKELCLITQREIGEDVADYKSALRQVLRQSPDVVMVGEIRDMETFEAVLTAAETGHLVFSAIHTADALRTFNRILGLYPHQERQEVRERLAQSLAAIISLRLLRRKDSAERVPAVEILRMNNTIGDCLRNDKMADILEHMLKGRDIYGMRTFDQHMIELWKAGIIDLQTARNAATRPTEIELINTLEGDDISGGIELSRPFERF